MAEQALKDKTASGLFWGALSNICQQLLNLCFGIFVARILSAADYGMVGMLSLFSLIAGSLQESGFISALVNKKDITHKDYNAVFWFSVLAGISMYISLFLCAPLIADFFNQPELIPLSRYVFLGFAISSFGTAQAAYLHKNLLVRQKSISTILALVISGCCGVLMAYWGYSYWGIATQSIVYIGVVMLCYWYFSPWRPSLKIDFSPLKELYSFSIKMLITNIFIHLNNNVFSIVLGRLFTENEVGFYNQANKWNQMGYSTINGMVHGVAQPVLAKVSEQRERQLHIFRKLMRFTAFVSFPALLGLSLVTPELIVIAITEKWAPSIPIMQLLCIYGAFFPLTGLCANLIISKGKSDVYMWNVIVLSLIILLAIYLSSPFGLNCMILVYVGLNILWLLVWHHFVNRILGYSLLNLLTDIMPFLLVSVFVMGITHYVTIPFENIYLRFIGKIFLAAISYAFIMWATNVHIFKECIDFFLKRKTAEK